VTIPINQTITRQGIGFTAAEWNPIIRAAWDRAGRLWHKKILGKHFTVAGAAEYNYMPRTRAYQIRKAKKFGHQRPLVFSGEAERMAHQVLDLRATQKGAKVVLHLPTHFYQYRKDLKQPDKGLELRTVSDPDAMVLGNEIDKGLQERIDEADRSGARVQIA
jgi:hypothetical protein